MTRPSTFGLVGSGWRAEFFVRLARWLPDRLCLVGAAVRRQEMVEVLNTRWGVPVYTTPRELVSRQHPDFVITSVRRDANPAVIGALVEAGCPVLSETPPAADIAGMTKLWETVGARRMVQVAEQYLLFPGHAARRALVGQGVIGQPTSVQVSSTHDYHAVSMIRGFLGTDFRPATISARRLNSQLLDPIDRGGWTKDRTPKNAVTTIATLDFGDSSGLYDFTHNQWHNQLRLRRVLVRGSHGEIHDDVVVHMAGADTILKSPILRSQLGYDLNLDGYDTEHLSFEGQVLWRNPFLGTRLMDEEIAIATLMMATGAWAQDEGPEPYPLAQACQDHAIALLIHQAADTEATLRTEVWPWSHADSNVER